jgi:hypothetical protein
MVGAKLAFDATHVYLTLACSDFLALSVVIEESLVAAAPEVGPAKSGPRTMTNVCMLKRPLS